MIVIDRERCTGCGLCIEVCPTGAITLVDNRAEVDVNLCDGCASLDAKSAQQCIELCPMEASSWVTMPDASTSIVPRPAVNLNPAVTSDAQILDGSSRDVITVHERDRSVLPVFGSALAWVGREIVPRLAPLALDVLDAALERRRTLGTSSKLSPTSKTQDKVSPRRGPNKQRRRHRRRGR